MPITALKIEGKETYPMFVFAKCCLSVHPPQIGGAWQACTQQNKEKSLPHNFWSFMSSLCACPAS